MKSSTLVIIMLLILGIVDFIFNLESKLYISFFVAIILFPLYMEILDAIERYQPTQVFQVTLADREDLPYCDRGDQGDEVSKI